MKSASVECDGVLVDPPPGAWLVLEELSHTELARELMLLARDQHLSPRSRAVLGESGLRLHALGRIVRDLP